MIRTRAMSSVLATALAGPLVVLPAAAATEAHGNVRISAGATEAGFLGDSVGVAFRDGDFVAAWPDGSPALPGNPDPPAPDVAFAALGGANVNVTARSGSQLGVSLAADPTNPDRLIAAALDGDGAIRAFSRDGGATWTTVPGLPGNFGGSDPEVAFDAFGNAYLALIHDATFGNPRLEVYVSTDGGATFEAVPLPDIGDQFQTRVSIAAGLGSVWLAFVGYDGAPILRTLAAPVAGPGAVGPFVAQTPPGGRDADDPAIALSPTGDVVLAFGHGRFGTTPSVSVQVDPDGLGGASFSDRTTVANVAGYPHSPRPRVAFRPDGSVVLVYQERQEAAGSEEIFLHVGDDGGSSWSAATRISDPVASSKRAAPNVAVDHATGTVGIAWLDYRSGASELWADIRATLATPPEPRAPVNLSATATSRSEISLAWQDTSGNETSFEITRRAVGSSEPVTTAILPSDTTSFLDSGLAEDTAFIYRVRALNAAGPSLWSNEAEATTLATPPPAPENLVATGVSFMRIDLTWDASANADHYGIESSRDGLTWTFQRNSLQTTAMLFELEPDTTYFFRVRAVNSGGPSPWSNIASARTEPSAPRPPSGLTATAVSYSQIDLTWSDGSTNEDWFEIERSVGGRTFKLVGSVGPNVTQFSDTRVKRGQDYAYRVRACNAVGCSAPSNVATATTPR